MVYKELSEKGNVITKKSGVTKKGGKQAKKSASAEEGYFKAGSRQIRKRNAYIILALITIGVASIFIVPQLQAIIQGEGAGTTGWATFEIVDGETGETLSGKIMLIEANDTDKKLDFEDFTETAGLYDNPVKDGEVIYMPESCYAMLYDVDLEEDKSRVWLPKTIGPIGSDDETKPYVNTIFVSFLVDPSDVEVAITEKDGTDGKYDHTDFNTDKDYKIDLEFNVTLRHDYSQYGDSSFVPDYYLNKEDLDLSKDEDINAYGLWMCFNGTELADADVDDYGSDFDDYYYIEDWDTTIVLLTPIWDEDGKIEVEFEMKSTPDEFFIFQGFLEDLEDTKILITK